MHLVRILWYLPQPSYYLNSAHDRIQLSGGEYSDPGLGAVHSPLLRTTIANEGYPLRAGASDLQVCRVQVVHKMHMIIPAIDYRQTKHAAHFCLNSYLLVVQVSGALLRRSLLIGQPWCS
jgi:hypothetical protein